MYRLFCSRQQKFTVTGQFLFNLHRWLRNKRGVGGGGDASTPDQSSPPLIGPVLKSLKKRFSKNLFSTTLKVENFAGTKFRGTKKPRNFCVSRVLNFAVAPSK